jgi:bifunctional DNase/RNase
MKLVEIVGLHIEASSGAPLVLLREHDEPHRVLPIFVGSPEAASIALALSGEAAPRPLTHDVMAALVTSVDAHVEAVEVTDLRDGAFLAELAISGPTGAMRLDTRPSDAIALAVRLGAPLFVSDAVLEEAGTLFVDDLDEEGIDDEVAEFRALLDDLDPTEIAGAIAELPGDSLPGEDADADDLDE